MDLTEPRDDKNALARPWRVSRRLLLAALCAGLGACADARSTPVRGPDAAEGWLEVTCRNEQQHCYDKALEQCPGGFDLAETRGRHAPGEGIAFYSGYMLVRCKPAQTPEGASTS
jgi:hypothetical protein